MNECSTVWHEAEKRTSEFQKCCLYVSKARSLVIVYVITVWSVEWGKKCIGFKAIINPRDWSCAGCVQVKGGFFFLLPRQREIVVLGCSTKGTKQKRISRNIMKKTENDVYLIIFISSIICVLNHQNTLRKLCTGEKIYSVKSDASVR